MIKLCILHFLLRIANSEELVDSPPEGNCENSIWFKGDCQDVYADSLCGEEALGERLYLGEDGLGYCDCDEGWVRYKERCYQEFTPAFCPGENEILKLNTKPKSSAGQLLFGESGDIVLAGMKHNFSCIENPCEPSYFPHTSTWNETLDTPNCHKPYNGLAGCELVVNENEDEFLDCCTPGNRTSCYIINQLVDYEDYGAIELFSLAPTGKKCRSGMMWSVVGRKCVEKFSG